MCEDGFCFGAYKWESNRGICSGGGIRQGDPLSPYLFILCVEILSNLLRKEETRGLRGVRAAPSSSIVSHLLFVDNFFSGATELEVDILKDILVTYEKVSGQKGNYDKTDVSFSASVVEEKRRRLTEKLNVHMVSVIS